MNSKAVLFPELISDSEADQRAELAAASGAASFAPLETFLQAVSSRKATDIVTLEIAPLTSIADYFIVCSGHSNRQVSAIADYVIADLKAQGIRPLSVEGLKEGHWVLIDYGHIVIHIFYTSVRSVYDLEGLWADARRVVCELKDKVSHEAEICD